MYSSCRASFSNIHPRAQTGTAKQHAMKMFCNSSRKSLLLPLPRMISRPAKTVENGDQLAATNLMADTSKCHRPAAKPALHAVNAHGPGLSMNLDRI